MIKVIEHLDNGIDFIEMKNDLLTVVVTNFGCTIQKIIVKDKNGNDVDCVLGYDTISEYQKYDAYLGALVGRVANRIGGGQFELNGKTYNLAVNNGPNSLHGGIKGFSYQTFKYEIEGDTIIFSYLSKDGEEGYPGNLDFKAIYSLEGSKLVVNYKATSDQDTLINITNHSYFNLSGKPDNIENHELLVSASRIACIDKDGLPTGELNDVQGTPFDFRNKKVIKDVIHLYDEQLEIGKGYDHPFIFDTSKDQVKLYCPTTGIQLTVSSTLPQAQLYTANYLDGRLGKNKQPMPGRSALAIETQNMPDSIHNEENPTVILKKGEQYDETTSYCFDVIK